MNFPDTHPFSEFNRYFYLESGTINMPIYIFKFDDKGAMIQLHFYDKINGPHGRLYGMTFQDEYNFELSGKILDIEGSTENSVLKKISNLLGAMRDGRSV